MIIWHAIVLGIIEGVTEFLPVSSTGHLILASHVLEIPQTEFLKTFEIAIQFGAILAVVALYWRSLLIDWESMTRVAVAFAPTAVLGLAFHGLVKMYLLGNAAVVLWSLAIGGVVLILFERFRPAESVGHDEGVNTLSLKTAFIVGCCQALALVPGVSRSGATIVGGMLLGASRKTIVEFSFLLAVPTIAAATVFDLATSWQHMTAATLPALLVGGAVSFVTALLAIRSFVAYVQHHSFAVFGWYRIAIAFVLALVLYLW